MERLIKDLESGDSIFRFTKDSVQELYIEEIHEVKYKKIDCSSDFQLFAIDLESAEKFNVILSGDTFMDKVGEDIFIINPYENIFGSTNK